MNAVDLTRSKSDAWIKDPLTLARLQRRLVDSEWAFANYDALRRQFGDQYVGVCNQQVVAYGMDHEELRKQAEAAGCLVEDLVLVPLLDPASEYPAE